YRSPATVEAIVRRRGIVDKQAGLSNKHNFGRIIKSKVRTVVICGIMTTDTRLPGCCSYLRQVGRLR
ncbi:MAG TPA: hypothetical protein PLP86_05600, partial [Armatimonadota bacterium]|nr:hypothetical protein [Armatimonadota bacterium]